MSAPRPLFIGLLVTLAIAGGMFYALKPPGKGADSDSALNAPISQAQKAVVQSQIAAAKAAREGTDAAASPAATSKPPTALTPVHPAHPAVTQPVHPVVQQPVAKPHPHAVKPPHKAAILHLASGDHSARILAALSHRKVAVVVFWTKGGADDDAVRRALVGLKKRGRIATFAFPMKAVGKYPAITTGVQISVSPTTLIIGPNHHYQQISGYTTVQALTQAVTLAR